MDSSYGSGAAFRHSADDTADFQRGIYLPWLHQEAKRRNPSILTYALSVGVPAFVGNGSYLSPGGVRYHTDYLQGARDVHNITFDYLGIWNEGPWSRRYVVDLRAALDKSGFGKTRIVVPDGHSSHRR
jgi:hypothetical protein